MVVFVPSEGPLTVELDRRGIKWHTLPTGAFRSTSRYWHCFRLPDPLAILYDIFIICRTGQLLVRKLYTEKIDLIHTNSILSHLTGGIASRRARIPCVWHMQDIIAPSAGLRLFHPFIRQCAETLVDRIVCISHAVAQQFASIKTPEKIKVIYNAIETELFTPWGSQPYRDRWLSGKDHFIVGQVGRLTPWKGQELLLSVARYAQHEHLPLKFVVIGDDSFGLPGYSHKLQAMARQFEVEDKIIFTGWLEDMPGVMRSLDALVHPSLSPEPFGLVIAEAMACARPVVVANHGGAREVVGSCDYGILFPPGDASACLSAIRQLFINPCEAQRMGLRARKRIESNFSFSRFVEEFAALYSSLA